MRGAVSELAQYIFMVWCLIKQWKRLHGLAISQAQRQFDFYLYLRGKVSSFHLKVHGSNLGLRSSILTGIFVVILSPFRSILEYYLTTGMESSFYIFLNLIYFYSALYNL
jgi:hypothetical protein